MVETATAGRSAMRGPWTGTSCATDFKVTMCEGGASAGRAVGSMRRCGGSWLHHSWRAGPCDRRHSCTSASVFCDSGSYMWIRISLKMTDRRHMLMKHDAECAVVGGYFHVTPTCCAPNGTHISSSAESSTGQDVSLARRARGCHGPYT